MTDELRNQVDDAVPDDIELFERGGKIFGRDDNDNDFQVEPMRGSAEPRDDRCGAVVTNTMERYGQTRYCTAMPVSKFVDGGSEFCKKHKSHEALMERAQELFKHGHFATNYVNFAKHLSATKFLFAVEMVGGLFELSQHEFEVVEESRTIDTSDSTLIQEDAVEVEMPIPTKTTLSLQADQLWQAALAEVEMNNMREAVFADASGGRMGEKTQVSKAADMEGTFTDTIDEQVEHHLHLPISRLTDDIKKHLKNGGVEFDDDDGAAITFEKNDYTMDVSPVDTDEAEEAVESTDAAEQFTEQLSGEPAEIEVE